LVLLIALLGLSSLLPTMPSTSAAPSLPPIPRQQIADALGGVIRQTCEAIGEPSVRIDVVELGGLCRPPNYAERFWKQPFVCAHLRPVERILLQFHSA
jgi:hypothetical protein